MHRPFYEITDNELFHFSNGVANEIYSLQLYFRTEREYNDCLVRLNNRLQVNGEGLILHYDERVYKLNIGDLTRGEGNIEHGYHSYSYLSHYIRVYWNNRTKRITFFHQE
jgi:hypothetical protein